MGNDNIDAAADNGDDDDDNQPGILATKSSSVSYHLKSFFY